MTSIRLTPAKGQERLDLYRRSAEPDVRLRAHMLLLLEAGHPWATIGAVLFCSVSTISRWKRRFEAEGVGAVFGRLLGRKRSKLHIWATPVVRWVPTYSRTERRSRLNPGRCSGGCRRARQRCSRTMWT